VETPLMSPYLIPEPAIEVFKTAYVNPYGAGWDGYLIPSPELWMKRLLAHGAGDIFQITKCFRNCESSGKQHNPEFTMLEWYTVESDYYTSMDVMEALITYICKHPALAALPGFELPIKRRSMHQVFKDILSIDLDTLMDIPAIKAQALRLGLTATDNTTWEELFNKIFITFIEPELTSLGTVILFDYPAQIVTLAKTTDDPHYAERWEMYSHGMEIANCFTEEIDPQKLATRLFEESSRKAKECHILHPTDWDLVNYFAEQYPPCSGVAVGIDRLFMSLCGISSIDQVLAFPFSEIFC